ncbi:transposase [Synechococcus sp. BDU 130192]|uniref:transposase n=1 Tax=Synechococcus sp. BDU 130192 TaxID=2042059 RepID=UPI00352B80E2
MNHWEKIISIFDYLMEIRKVIYATNTIDSLNRSLYKVIKIKAVFLDQDSVFRLMYLAMRNIAHKWKRFMRDRKATLSDFSIFFRNVFFFNSLYIKLRSLSCRSTQALYFRIFFLI